jgi:hypothetical protein
MEPDNGFRRDKGYGRGNGHDNVLETQQRATELWYFW